MKLFYGLLNKETERLSHFPTDVHLIISRPTIQIQTHWFQSPCFLPLDWTKKIQKVKNNLTAGRTDWGKTKDLSYLPYHHQ